MTKQLDSKALKALQKLAAGKSWPLRGVTAAWLRLHGLARVSNGGRLEITEAGRAALALERFPRLFEPKI